ncbi:MAG: phosphatidylglycerol lysyltransferase domain-containing protein [Bacillales bacterium]|jgi:hypothetical protein|nr:phosphatidylglycerol lysyltransferase domain-containing protein [Bacillales bacterium]
MTFRLIQKEDASLFAKYKGFGWEYCFPYLFIISHFGQFTMCYQDDVIYVKFVLPTKVYFLRPYLNDLSKLNNAIDNIYKYCQDHNLTFEIIGLRENDLDYISDKYYTFSTENDSEYVYLSFDLIYLIGKKYQPKRNYINRFRYANNYTFIDYQEKYKKQVIELLNLWSKQANKINDVGEILSALEVYEELKTLNAFIKLLISDNTLIGIVIGCLQNDIAYTMYEKALVEYEGSFQMINQLTASTCYHNVKYIDRMEDMGDEGLRKAKKSYYPCLMINKRRLIKKDLSY